MAEPNLIRALQFEPDGELIIEFTRLAHDVRANGIMLNHTMFLPNTSEYDDSIDALRDCALALLADALEDLERVGPIRPKGEPDDDDDADDDDENDDDRGDG